MMINTAPKTRSQELNSHIFIQTPQWITRRKEISHLSKSLYGLIKSDSIKHGYAFRSRESMAEILGCPLRTLDRAIQQLKQHNLIVIKQCGLNAPTQYILPDHIWMVGAKTYSKPAENKVSPLAATPYKDDKIINKFIYNKNNNTIPRTRANVPKFEQDFEKFYSVHPRPVNKIETYAAFVKALDKITAQKLIDKAKAFDSSLIAENERKFCKGSLRWLQEECYKQDYGRHEVDYCENYANNFKNHTNKIPGEQELSKPTQEEKDKVSELLRGAGFRPRKSGVDVFKKNKAAAA